MNESKRSTKGCLYIVPTPIGNLADMVPRAIDILQTVDLIAAEDTRHSAKLLQHFQINTPLTAYHDHSHQHKLQALLEKMDNGQQLALISDAGTPLVSDPGYRLVNLARQQGIRVIPIPGPCAAIAALSASGLPSDRFTFEGFPPAKSSARQATYMALSVDPRTLIFYESPHRILASLTDIVKCFGAERHIVLAREITKTFETFLSGPVTEVLQAVTADHNQQKGEIVLLIHGFVAEDTDGHTIGESAQALMRVLRQENLPLKRAAAITATIFSEKKNRLYEWGIENLE